MMMLHHSHGTIFWLFVAVIATTVAGTATETIPVSAPRRRHLQFPAIPHPIPAPANPAQGPAPSDDEYYEGGEGDDEYYNEGDGDDEYYDEGPTSSPYPTDPPGGSVPVPAPPVPAPWGATTAAPGPPPVPAPWGTVTQAPVPPVPAPWGTVTQAPLPAPAPWGATTSAPIASVPAPFGAATPAPGSNATMYNETSMAPVPAPVPGMPPGLPVVTAAPTGVPAIAVTTAMPTGVPVGGGDSEDSGDDYYSDSNEDDRYNNDDFAPTNSPAPTIADGADLTPSYGNEPWNDYVNTPEPTVLYIPPDDDVLSSEDDDKIKEEWAQKTNLEKAEAEWDEIRHDRNVKIVSIVFGVTGFLLLVFVAHQLIENPDGCFGKICRCVLACVGILCCPLRAIFCRNARARERRTHQLVQNEPGTYGYSHDLELT